MRKYIPQRIEKKWQKLWEDSNLYKTSDKVRGKENIYCLDMFPYPSGEKLHVGHLHGYVGSDVASRYLRLKGANVLHPMGFDAFGLPAENAAIKRKIHPKTWTYRNIKGMEKQLKALGTVYDWSREVMTCEPDYYKWTQWMFLQLYKAGLAYRAKVPVNWCPSCKTVLANEQVVNGKCERCDSEVIQQKKEQWLFRITKTADDLLSGLEKLDWPETTKTMQKNWIGRSEGWEIKFSILKSRTKIPVFTTRTDTLFGCTYLVIAPEHEIISKFEDRILNIKAVQRYAAKSKKRTERERISGVKEKTGIEIRGIKAINPVNQREIPIFIADYVLVHYGTGAIMAVPAHDQRDFDFARKYNLPVIEVIKPYSENKKLPKRASLVISNGRFKQAYKGEGVLINSGRFNGMESETAKERIGEWLAKKEQSKNTVYYKLRDWIISRQRYWGAPIPMIFCKNCGWMPVPEKELPVLLPNIKDFRPNAEGKSPLSKSKKFTETICPECKGQAQRETDTMDTFVCSSWYFLRYIDPQNKKKFASEARLKRWLPVDIYIGGAEHSVMHLLYARFFTKVLKQLGYLDFDEPFLKLRHQGIILGPDHTKMSKSKGNIISPDSVIKKYGIDTLRLYEMFMGPFAETAAWDMKGIVGVRRFLEKIWKLQKRVNQKGRIKNEALERLVHKTIKKVSKDIEDFKFNTAISSLMVLANEMEKQEEISLIHYSRFLILLSPFAPHLTEELWQSIKKGSSVHSQSWPKYNPKMVKEEKITLVIQINGKVRDKIEVGIGISENEASKLALEQEKIKKWLAGKRVKKVVFVKNRLINIVV